MIAGDGARRSAKDVTTPIDFDDLVARGVLAKADRGWYYLLDFKKLPRHARQQIVGFASSKKGRKVKFLTNDVKCLAVGQTLAERH